MCIISRKKGGKLKEIAEMNYVRAPWYDGMEEAFSEERELFYHSNYRRRVKKIQFEAAGLK